jgi:hypothetical protein
VQDRVTDAATRFVCPLFFRLRAQMDDSSVISFLLQTEIIPLCLRIMETGNELSKTVRPASYPSQAWPPNTHGLIRSAVR